MRPFMYYATKRTTNRRLLQEQAAQAAFFATWKNFSPVPRMQILTDLTYMAQAAILTEMTPDPAHELLQCFIAYFRVLDPENGKGVLDSMT